MGQPPPIDWRTDEQLVAAINRGDDSAFDALYFRYRDWIVRLAYRFTTNHDDALDVLQDTFAYLLNRVPHLTLTARMTTFLYPVVRSLSITILRRRQKEGRAARQAETSLTAPPPAFAWSRSDLAAVLAVLPEAQREVLLMRYVDEMSLAEVAQVLAIPLGTVKSRLHNALAALRKDERTRQYFAS